MTHGAGRWITVGVCEPSRISAGPLKTVSDDVTYGFGALTRIGFSEGEGGLPTALLNKCFEAASDATIPIGAVVLKCSCASPTKLMIATPEINNAKVSSRHRCLGVQTKGSWFW